MCHPDQEDVKTNNIALEGPDQLDNTACSGRVLTKSVSDGCVCIE